MQKKFIRFCLGGTKEPVNNFEQCTDNFLKIEVQLIYNVVLVAGVQQSDSLYICIHTHTHTYTLHVTHAYRRLKLYMPMLQNYTEDQLKLFLESKAKAFPQC